MDTALDTLVIAVDGTAGSGKSSTSRGVANKLGLRYLDTGAMYRAMAWHQLQAGVDVSAADAVARHAESAVIESGTDPERPTILLGGADVSTEIRSDEATSAVSAGSAVPRVREILVAQQRAIIGRGGIVVGVDEQDGRHRTARRHRRDRTAVRHDDGVERSERA